ncbi:hypothetical protein ACFP47_10165 [Nesterenkonia lacusekhoensis]|uniref:DUF3168 domain-containing protein n=1 Tax=Nesterenkonia lacusekhoensis TaxID=150832 RepID=A0ABS4T5X5_9MICC|nr:hypothetical protein [Nesterenkonia lacusekhoensis]MBP2319565.1 hypothetical protein [Nesterenkonia lacusekhoensis]
MNLTVADAVQAILEPLEEIFTFDGADTPNVYRRKAAQSLPTDAWGRILPGAILRTRTPVPVSDTALDGKQVLDARVHRFQTLLFADNENHLDEAIDRVAQALTGLQIGQFTLRHATEDDPVQPIHDDPHLDRPYTYFYWSLIG